MSNNLKCNKNAVYMCKTKQQDIETLKTTTKILEFILKVNTQPSDKIL